MICQIRNSIFTKILLGILVLHLINISIDSPDGFGQQFAEDLSFNDQESIVELVVEEILGFEDAFKEYDDHDPEDHNKKPTLKIEIVPQQVFALHTKRECLASRKTSFANFSAFIHNGYCQLDIPPPKI